MTATTPSSDPGTDTLDLRSPAPEATGPSPAPEGAALPARTDDPAGRGVTTIAPQVVEKIALRAATEVEGVTLVARGLDRVLGRTPGTAEVDARTAAIELPVCIRYPLPVAATCDEVRRSVARRVHELTGRTLEQVDIVVVKLANERPARVR